MHVPDPRSPIASNPNHVDEADPLAGFVSSLATPPPPKKATAKRPWKRTASPSGDLVAMAPTADPARPEQADEPPTSEDLLRNVSDTTRMVAEGIRFAAKKAEEKAKKAEDRERRIQEKAREREAKAPPPPAPRFAAYLAALPGAARTEDEDDEEYVTRLGALSASLREAWKRDLVGDNALRLRQIEVLLPTRPKRSSGFRASGKARTEWYRHVGEILGVHRDQVKWAVAAYEAIVDFEQRAARRPLKWPWEKVMELLLSRQLRHVPAACAYTLHNQDPDADNPPLGRHPSGPKFHDPDDEIDAIWRVVKRLDPITLRRARDDIHLLVMETYATTIVPRVGEVLPIGYVDGLPAYDERALTDAKVQPPPGTTVARDVGKLMGAAYRVEGRRVARVAGSWWLIGTVPENGDVASSFSTTTTGESESVEQ